MLNMEFPLFAAGVLRKEVIPLNRKGNRLPDVERCSLAIMPPDRGSAVARTTAGVSFTKACINPISGNECPYQSSEPKSSRRVVAKLVTIAALCTSNPDSSSSTVEKTIIAPECRLVPGIFGRLWSTSIMCRFVAIIPVELTKKPVPSIGGKSGGLPCLASAS